jgi:subtilisin family serine protease
MGRKLRRTRVFLLALLLVSVSVLIFSNSSEFLVKLEQDATLDVSSKVQSYKQDDVFKVEFSQDDVLKPKVDKIVNGIHEDIRKEIEDNVNSGEDEKVTVLLQLTSDNFEVISSSIQDVGGEVTGSYAVGDVISADIPASKVEEISKEVESVWPNREYELLLDDSHDLIHTNVAWDLGYTGKGIKVAILDTGIDEDHEMFGDRVVESAAFTNEDHTDDRQGHGTHVAGIVAGNGLSKGVAPEALLYNAKVLSDNGRGDGKSIIAGVNWALDPDGDGDYSDKADVISISIGGAYNDQDGPLVKALREAINNGVVVVLASGNCGKGCRGFYGVTTPADMEEAIAVGAVDSNKNLARFSSYQDFGTYSKPDVVAPGVNILSSIVDGYGIRSGTSMAAPFVTGMAALVLEVNPGMSHSAVKSLLIDSSRDLGPEGKDVMYGSGLVDVAELLGVNVSDYVEEEVVKIDLPATDDDLSFIKKVAPKLVNVTFEDELLLFENQLFIVRSEDARKVFADITSPSGEVERVNFNHNFNTGWTGVALNTKKKGKYSLKLIVWNEIDQVVYLDEFDVVHKVDEDDFVINENVDEFVFVDSAISESRYHEQLKEVFIRYNSSGGVSIVKIIPFPTEDSLNYYLDNAYPKIFWDSTLPFRDKEIITYSDSLYWTSDNVWVEIASETFPTKLIASYMLKFPNDFSSKDFVLNDYDLFSLSLEEGQGRVSSMPDVTYIGKKSNKTLDLSRDERFELAELYYVAEEEVPLNESNLSLSAQGVFCWKDSDCDSRNYCSTFGQTLIFNEYCYGETWFNPGLCLTKSSENCNDYDTEYCKTENYMYEKEGSCSGSSGSADCKITSVLSKNCNDDNDVSDTTYYCNEGDIWTTYWSNDYDCVESSGVPSCKKDYSDSKFKDELYEECEADQYCSKGKCYDASIDKAYWSDSSADEGDTVTMYVESSFPKDKSVSYYIYEDDYWPDGPDYVDSASGKTDSSGDDSENWVTKYDDDGWIPYDSYYFTTTIGSDSKSSGSMSINQMCFDDDSDGYNKIGSCGGNDCNDGDSSVHNGATESCNGVDDDCDGYIDEGGACGCGDCGLGFWNACDKVECLDLGECYYKDYLVVGTCSNAPSAGSDDYCLYKSQNKGGCEHGEYDCDPNQCATGLQCDDGGFLNGYLVEGGCCKDNEKWDPVNNKCYVPCKISKTEWEFTTVNSGEEVKLYVYGGLGCDGKTIEFEVYEDDCFGLTEVNDSGYNSQGICETPVDKQPKSVTFNLGVASSTWTAEYHSDIAGNPDYYFHSIVDGDEYTSKNVLNVKNCDKDGDGYNADYCQGGTDCNDGDPEIYKDAPERCNNLDDDCDRQKDEDFDLNEDDNNCGRCGKKCSTGTECRAGSCMPISNCAQDECYSFWGDCYKEGELCCAQDNYNPDPKVTYGQYICKADTGWGSCSPELGHTSCEKINGNYCTLQDGLWKWRTCANGCVDGSCINNQCTVDTDCSSGLICDSSGPMNVCIPKPAETECEKPGDYVCSGEMINKCVDRYGEGYYELSPIKYCRGDTVCVNGYSTCQAKGVKTDIQIEHAPDGVLVYKQPNDYLRVKLKYLRDEVISFDYDLTKFVLVEGDCNAGSITIREDHDCLFMVDFALEGSSSFKIDAGDEELVSIISDPSLLLVTNKVKLYERFPDDWEGVAKVLEQTYQQAIEDDERGVVYDVDEYVFTPKVLDNSYAQEVAGFIADKCSTCKNVVIVGDDEVIPYHKKSIPLRVDSQYDFGLPDVQSDGLYSDTLYTPVAMPSFGDLNTDKFFSYGQVIVVVPPYLMNDKRIKDLRQSIFDTYGRQFCSCQSYEYNSFCLSPNFTFIECEDTIASNKCADERKDNCPLGYETQVSGFMSSGSNFLNSVNDVQLMDASEIGCDSFRDLGTSTVVMIGNSKNNNAIKCLPWIEQPDYTGLSIQRNVWDKRGYSLVLNLPDEISEPMLNVSLKVLQLIVENGKWQDGLGGYRQLDLIELGLLPAAFIAPPPFDAAPDLYAAAVDCPQILNFDSKWRLQHYDAGMMFYCALDGVGIAIPAFMAYGTRSSLRGFNALQHVTGPGADSVKAVSRYNPMEASLFVTYKGKVMPERMDTLRVHSPGLSKLPYITPAQRQAGVISETANALDGIRYAQYSSKYDEIDDFRKLYPGLTESEIQLKYAQYASRLGKQGSQVYKDFYTLTKSYNLIFDTQYLIKEVGFTLSEVEQLQKSFNNGLREIRKLRNSVSSMTQLRYIQNLEEIYPIDFIAIEEFIRQIGILNNGVNSFVKKGGKMVHVKVTLADNIKYLYNNFDFGRNTPEFRVMAYKDGVRGSAGATFHNYVDKFGKPYLDEFGKPFFPGIVDFKNMYIDMPLMVKNRGNRLLFAADNEYFIKVTLFHEGSHVEFMYNIGYPYFVQLKNAPKINNLDHLRIALTRGYYEYAAITMPTVGNRLDIIRKEEYLFNHLRKIRETRNFLTDSQELARALKDPEDVAAHLAFLESFKGWRGVQGEVYPHIYDDLVNSYESLITHLNLLSSQGFGKHVNEVFEFSEIMRSENLIDTKLNKVNIQSAAQRYADKAVELKGYDHYLRKEAIK